MLRNCNKWKQEATKQPEILVIDDWGKRWKQEREGEKLHSSTYMQLPDCSRMLYLSPVSQSQNKEASCPNPTAPSSFVKLPAEKI